jgi:serine O-acetyltransferase
MTTTIPPLDANLFTAIAGDLYAASRTRSLRNLIRTALLSRGFHAMLLHRMGRLFLYLPFIGIIPARITAYLASTLYGTEISPYARLAPGINPPHPTGVIIGDGVAIGSGTTIMQHVTIGARDSHATKINTYSLVSGRNVFIGAGAVVIGNISLGDRCRIGANAVVLNDVPEGITVTGIPAKKHKSAPTR